MILHRYVGLILGTFRSQADIKKRLLLENIVKCLLDKGCVTIEEIRKKTQFRFDSREISWSLKRLRKLDVVTYDSRVWYANENVLMGLRLLAIQEIVSLILKR